MRTKTNSLFNALSGCDYDAVALTETWLNSTFLDSELTTDYTLYRCDRCSTGNVLRRGGGVLIAVKKTLNSCLITPYADSDLEQIFVRIKLHNSLLFIGAIYLPPNTNAERYQKHVECIEKVCDSAGENDKIVVVGDYNLPRIEWFRDDELGSMNARSLMSESESVLLETVASLGLHQMNEIANQNGRILDLAFVSDPDNSECVECVLPLMKVDVHHIPIVLILEDTIETSLLTHNNYYYDFEHCNFLAMHDALLNKDWCSILSVGSVDEAADNFYTHLFDLIREHVPVKRRRQQQLPTQPWWSPELRNCRNRLRKARKRYFRRRSDDNKIKMRDLETEYNQLNAECLLSYTHRMECSLKVNPKSFWAFIKRRKQPQGVPTNVFYKDSSADAPEDAANLFSSFFRNVLSNNLPPSSESYLNSLPVHDLDIPRFSFSRQEILDKLLSVDVTKGAGPDLLPPSFIQRYAEVIATPTAILFNRSLSEGSFPCVWKTASIIPIHKTGNIHNIENYRGISTLSCLPKVFERLVHDAVYPLVHNIIDPNQHGFVKKRSTTTNLMAYVSSLVESLDNRKQIDAVYVDFSKAFDKVPHLLAIRKLEKMGMPDWLTLWLESYLTGRNAYVRLGATCSASFDITSGVPQGSILGPLLFVLFINDICGIIQSTMSLFADDSKFYKIIDTVADCLALQNDIDSLLEWCRLNGMEANIKKCNSITFTRKKNPIVFDYRMAGAPLTKISTVKDLGVYIDSKLTFAEHVTVTSTKAYAVLGFIRRNTRSFRNVYCLKALYCTLVRSLLEYCVQVWAPYFTTHSDRIERIQKSFVRFALRHLPWNNPTLLPPYAERCRLINLPTLSARRTMLQRLFVFDLLNNNIDCSNLLGRLRFNAPRRRYRHHEFFRSSFNRTVYGQNNPLWNDYGR